MWESPLNKIYGEIHEQIVKQDEENMMYAVNQAVGYKVDKEELIKALQYDREQYKKGKKEMQEKINEAIEDIKECSFTATLHDKDFFMGVDKVEFVRLDTVLMILNKLMESGD